MEDTPLRFSPALKHDLNKQRDNGSVVRECDTRLTAGVCTPHCACVRVCVCRANTIPGKLTGHRGRVSPGLTTPRAKLTRTFVLSTCVD